MIILPEDKNIIALLSGDEKQLLLLALFSEDDDMPEIQGAALVAYTAIKSKSIRISKRKSTAGKKGAETTNSGKGRQTATGVGKERQTAATVTDTVTDTVSETVSETETDTKDFNNDDDNARAREGPAGVNKKLGAAITAYEQAFQSIPPPIAIDDLTEFAEALSQEVIAYAFQVAAGERKNNWSYIKAILRDYRDKGFKTVFDVKSAEAEREKRKKGGGKNGANANRRGDIKRYQPDYANANGFATRFDWQDDNDDDDGGGRDGDGGGNSSIKPPGFIESGPAGFTSVINAGLRPGVAREGDVDSS
ncbi:MAG: DnaD domain protein [Oscillospiraceae bacterium]|jgi:DnaD/phage-associated family protein|nr:DnaD domain protein [Oscillospiraceae bacterium]